MRDAQWLRDDEPHVAINSRAGVKTRISVTRMIHAHGDDVVRIPFQIRRQIVFKTNKAKRSRPHKLAVDPNFGMVINAIEFNRHKLVFLRRVDLEMFSIPADAAGHEAIAAAEFRAERTLDAPIMRHI